MFCSRQAALVGVEADHAAAAVGDERLAVGVDRGAGLAGLPSRTTVSSSMRSKRFSSSAERSSVGMRAPRRVDLVEGTLPGGLVLAGELLAVAGTGEKLLGLGPRVARLSRMSWMEVGI